MKTRTIEFGDPRNRRWLKVYFQPRRWSEWWIRPSQFGLVIAMGPLLVRYFKLARA